MFLDNNENLKQAQTQTQVDELEKKVSKNFKKISTIETSLPTLKCQCSVTNISKFVNDSNYVSNQALVNCLNDAKAFTNTSNATTLANAKDYANLCAANTLASAKTYTDSKCDIALSTAERNSDTKATNALNQAKTYADEKIELLKPIVLNWT